MRVAVIGAGPAGAYVAGELARQGHDVLLADKRRDPSATADERRSIQLSVSPRGVKALRAAGLEEGLRAIAIPLVGRAFHPPGRAEILVQRPSDPTWQNLSVGRGPLTRLALDHALGHSRVTARLGESCIEVLRDQRAIVLQKEDGAITVEHVDAVVGADGVASEVRTALVRSPAIDFAKRSSPWGYAELTVTPLDGRHRYETPAIHIWPRGRFFVVAFPSHDGTYRATLVARHEDWDPLAASGGLQEWLEAELPDLFPHLAHRGAGLLPTQLASIPIVRCGRWDDGGWMVVLGDAAHATAPFMGQGVNLALEDAAALCELTARHGDELAPALRSFSTTRVAEGIACCDLSERAANLLLQMPPPGADPDQGPLSLLNFRGFRYAEVAARMIPGWKPRVYTDAFPPSPGASSEIPDELAEWSDVPAGTRLFEQGDTASELFVVREGVVRVTSPERGDVRLRGPTIAGEMGYFGVPHRTAALVTETPCRLGRVTYAALEALSRERPELGVQVVRRLAGIAIDRLKERFHLRARYLALVAGPGQAERLADWALHHRERLAGEALVVDGFTGALLEERANLHPVRWIRLPSHGGARQLTALVESGTVSGVAWLADESSPELVEACRAAKVKLARTFAETDELVVRP